MRHLPALALGVLAGCSWPVSSEEHQLAAVRSPGRLVTAVVIENITDGMGLGSFTQSVFLRRDSDQKDICDILLIDVAPAPDAGIRLRWLSESRLSIAYSAGSVQYQVVKCQGVDITTEKVTA